MPRPPLMPSRAPRVSVAIFIVLAAFLTTGPVSAQPLADTSMTGSWVGTLSVPDGDFRVVFHLRRSPDGSLTGTMDSPDQGATGIPLSEVARSADTLRVGVRSIGGRFAGVIQSETGVVEGQWAQGPARLPLTLRKTQEAPSINRPQEPSEPVPYRVSERTFRAPDGVSLAGTLTHPEGAGPFPGILLIAGAGAQDRDASVAGHRPFLVWADRLTRAGFAVFRYDERGVGASEGQTRGLTTEELSRDAEAALQTLARHPGVEASSLGLVGHSEGGTIATMLANRSASVRAVVLLATPAVPGDEVLSDQLDIRAKANNVDERTRAMQRGTQQRIFRAITQNTDSTVIAAELRRIMIDTQGIRGEDMIQSEIQRLTAPWLRAFIQYDPAPALRRLDVPVLALYGMKDTQLKPAKNTASLREALNAGSSPESTLRQIDQGNHLLQPAETGRPSEYGRIETTVAPEALDTVTQWLQAHLP